MTLDITCTDMFCGAGGSTTGATQAGADVRLAINHWPRAIETHHANYPQTSHVLTDLQTASPRRFPSTTILLASPECTAHTLAKGRKRTNQGQAPLWGSEEPSQEAEAEERSRCTMWTPLDWAEYHDYQAIILENVVDAHLWRPFPAWLQAWKSLGYDYELVYLNSMFAHPTPQSRDRMYFVAWKRGNKKPDLRIQPLAYCPTCEQDVASVQSWKNPQRRYGKYKQQYVYRCPLHAEEVIPYYYAAANAIDWSLPAPRIGDRKKPLRAKTMERIAYGLQKFASRSQQAFMVQVNKTTNRVRALGETFPTQTGDNGLALVLHTSHSECGHASYVASAHESALPTQTTRQDLALALPPFLLNLNHAEARPLAVGDQPFPTQTGYDATGLTVPPFLMDHLGEYRPRAITGPCSTICAAGNHHSLITPPVQSWLMTYYRNGQLAPVQEAAPTVTTLARHALVTSDAATLPAVEECGFRMLVPSEIQTAMAFPSAYILTGTRREQITQLGNAVTPPAMKLLMERVITSLTGGSHV